MTDNDDWAATFVRCLTAMRLDPTPCERLLAESLRLGGLTPYAAAGTIDQWRAKEVAR